MSWPPLHERLEALYAPGQLLYMSAYGTCTTPVLYSEIGGLQWLTESAAFIVHVVRFYVLQLNIPTRTNFKKVRDDAFSDFWTKATGRAVKSGTLQHANMIVNLQLLRRTLRQRKVHQLWCHRCCPEPTEMFWI